MSPGREMYTRKAHGPCSVSIRTSEGTRGSPRGGWPHIPSLLCNSVGPSPPKPVGFCSKDVLVYESIDFQGCPQRVKNAEYAKSPSFALGYTHQTQTRQTLPKTRSGPFKTNEHVCLLQKHFNVFQGQIIRDLQ